MLFSFILGLGVKGNEVEQLPHTAPDPVTVALLQFLRIQIGRGMGTYASFHEQVITGQQDLPHHIAVGSKVSSPGFHPEVIETVEAAIAIIFDDTETDMVEPKGDIAGRNDLVGPKVWGDVSDKLHETGLPTAHGAGEQNPLVGIEAHFSASAKIPNGIVAELEQDFLILFINLEFPTEEQFPFSLQIDQDLFKIIEDLVSLELSQRILHSSFDNDMWRVVSQSGSL